MWHTVSRSLFKNVLQKILCRLRCRIEDIIGLTMESKKKEIFQSQLWRVPGAEQAARAMIYATVEKLDSNEH